ncbi:Phosphoethanolamine transferase specific forthe outer Kdo residue of lipopolysaccharide [Salmonella enterica subsp. enterica]|nr:Phosphoethanolamine transferase specific forthe outer Kdo residue of lipopolysaccharide [Salmonella enterica subsp. enterica]
MAPPEQFRVPMLVWMSDKYLASPQHAQMFAHLKQQAEIKVPRRHVETVRYDNGLPGVYIAGWRH